MNILHYIRIAIKSLFRDKLYAAINISGLALGLGLSIIILLIIKYELSYDSQIKDSENIYRLTTKGKASDGSRIINDALTPLPLSDVIINFKETESVTRLIPGANKLIRYNTASLSKNRFFFADPSFFNVFELKIINGSVNDLTIPGNVVITKTIADKYFNNTDPAGKSITRGGIKYNIIAVCEDMPGASHLHFDFIASIVSIEEMFNSDKQILEEWKKNWQLLTCYTYVKVKPETDIRLFEEHLNKHLGQLGKERETADEISQKNNSHIFHLQPIRTIHLHSKLNSEPEPISNPFRVIVFIAIAIFILIITSINFINITTANPSKRLRESVIRKTLGAKRYHIAIQIFTEAFIISGAATVMGMVLAELMIPLFNKLFELKLNINQIQGLQDIGIVILTTFIIGIISGGYPAKFFIRIDPVYIFSDRYKISKSSFVIRGIIIAGNVFVVLFLSVLTAGIWQQLNYISNTDLGFNKNNLLIIERAYTLKPDDEDFKKEVKNINGVLNISSATSVPGETYMKNIYTYKGISRTQKIPLTINYVDCDYLQTMQLTLKKGSFLNCQTRDSLGIVLNSAAIKKLGIKKPLEEYLETEEFRKTKWSLNILGVVDDYNYESLNNKIQPMGLILLCRHNYFRYMIIRLNDKNNKEAITEIHTLWNKYTDNEPLDSFFLDDHLNNAYKDDRRMLTALIIITIFSYFLSTLGFLSFASFLIEYKSKKISLMRTIGVADNYILRDMIGSFGKYILIGISLAIFTAIFTIKIWLNNFAFTRNISFVTFIILILLVSATGIISISFQYYRLVFRKTGYFLTVKKFFNQN